MELPERHCEPHQVALTYEAKMFPDLRKRYSQTSLAMPQTEPQSSNVKGPIFNHPTASGAATYKNRLLCTEGWHLLQQWKPLSVV